jgi:DNA-binding IclR family transcriptional regulator
MRYGEMVCQYRETRTLMSRRVRIAGTRVQPSVKKAVEQTVGATSGKRLDGVQSVRRACMLMDQVAQNPDGLSLAALSRSLKLHTSTTFHIARTLVTIGYLRQDDRTKTYRIGPSVFALASAALDEVELVNAARPVLAELASSTGETSYFGAMAGEKLVVLAKHDGTGAIRINDRIGNVRPLHCTALGKVMLAARSKDQLDAFLETATLEIFTPRTLRTREALVAEIDAVRHSGIAFDDGEVSDELRCAAAPVLDFSGRVVGTLGISGPSWRLSLQALHKNAEILKSAAERLSAALGSLSGSKRVR